MLQIGVRHLWRGPVRTDTTLKPDSEVLSGLGIAFTEPVEITGELQSTEEGDFLWRGHLRASVLGECRRCLTPVTQVVNETVEVLFSAEPELADDPTVYPIAPDAETVDVSRAVREEVALRVPAFPLCREECKGLCAVCGADLNAGPCEHVHAGTTS